MIDEVRDTAALRALYEEHAPSLYRLAVAMIGDPVQAEDLVHDAFVRLHRVARPPASGTERAYLRRTVVNLAHDHHRHRAVVRRATVPANPYDPPSVEVVAAGAERDGVVAAAVASLPARQRDCVVLHYFAELPDSEIAADLGISVGSVKTHLHRARASLARRLEDLR